MRSSKSQRGTILLVTMVLACALAIVFAYYIRVPLTALKESNRSFYSNSAMNLVDSGLEEALWCMNNGGKWTTAGFTAFTGADGTTQYQGTFIFTPPNSVTLSNGVTDVVKVWADPNSANPQAVAQATITFPSGSDNAGNIVKEAEIYMTQSSYFKDGLVAKSTITLSGNPQVDGWNSDPNGTYVPYDPANVDVNGTANGRIGSTDVASGSITGTGNSAVYGHAAVGGSAANDIGGSGLTVGPYGSTGVNASYVTYDFATSFPDTTTPTQDTYTDPTTKQETSVALTSGNTNTLSNITSNTTLPNAGDASITINGVTTYYYYVTSIRLSGNKTLSISPGKNVVLMVGSATATSTTISTSGNAGISIPGATTTSGVTTPASSLVMYTAGNVSLSGNGVMNGGLTNSTASPPVDFQLYGTRSSANATSEGEQSLSLSGNGVLSGVVYAPNANVTITGNGDTLGAVVGNQVTMSGNGSFHYDSSLANFGSSGLWNLTKWRELFTANDRSPYTTQLNF
jgi:hypothetical protein